ncbi:MAG TPA: D-amino acid aminotransferase [Gammaproteobacteria bacterium]|nr:D-amino acid aminotransferase [Gammaproteobacteria bacterium]
MARTLPVAFLNGHYISAHDARISPFDRGFLFGDGVYEVMPVYAGRIFRLTEHLARLQASCDAIRLANPHSAADWRALLETLVHKNGGGEQALYLQVTRGAPEERDHLFPRDVPPTVFAFCWELAAPPEWMHREGIAAVTIPDIRWQRCDIKATTLLGNVLLRQEAADRGAHEAILVRGDRAVEGTAMSLFVVHDGVMTTPPKGNELLPGITRDVVLELASDNDLPWREEAVTLDRLFSADEIWLTSTTREVLPVTRLNGKPVGTGVPGPYWRRMHELFQRHKAEFLDAAA